MSPEHLRMVNNLCIVNSSTELFLIMQEMWAVVCFSATFFMVMLTLMTHVQRGRVRQRLQ
jgi:hypothetical protein